MIGAAAARRLAGGRAGRPGPRRAAVAAAGGPVTTPDGRAGQRGSIGRRSTGSIRSPSGGSSGTTASAPATRSPRTSSPTRTCSRRSSPRPTPVTGDRVLEIGPGLGILTGALLAGGRRGDRGGAGPAVSPRSSATGSDVGHGRERRRARSRANSGSSRATRWTRTCPDSFRRRTSSSRTCRTTSRARSSTGCSGGRRARSGWS